MKITLIQAEKAYLAMETLNNQLLPCRMAKAICDNRNELKNQVDFLIMEERKAVEVYGAVTCGGNAFKVPDDEDKNLEFLQKIRELHEMDVEIPITIIPEEELLSCAKMRPSEYDEIRFMLTNE